MSHPAPMVETSQVGPSRPVQRVLVITFDFPPSDEVGAYSCAQLTRHLPLHGWEPWVLTGPGAAVRPGTEEQGGFEFPGPVIRSLVMAHPFQLYRTVRGALRRSVPAVRDLEMASTSVPAERSGWRSVRELLETPDANTGWIASAIFRGLLVVRRHGIRHLFSSAPCWSNHLVGLALARFTGLPWTAHFRDPWLEAAPHTPASPMARRLTAMLEGRVIRHADNVVCVTEEHEAVLRRRYACVSRARFATVPNGFDGAEWDDPPPSDSLADNRAAGQFVITYAGTLYQRRSPQPLFVALRSLLDSRVIDRDRVRVELIGWCDMAEGESVVAMAERHGVADLLHLTGPLDRTETRRRLYQSHLLLLLAEGWTVQIPAKTYEYLRTGRPILALTSAGALASLLERTGGAWVATPADQDRIVAALRETYSAWIRGESLQPRGPLTAVESLDRRVLAGQFARIFEAGRWEHQTRIVERSRA